MNFHVHHYTLFPWAVQFCFFPALCLTFMFWHAMMAIIKAPTENDAAFPAFQREARMLKGPRAAAADTPPELRCKKPFAQASPPCPRYWAMSQNQGGTVLIFKAPLEFFRGCLFASPQ
jgi:hypothetical protein